MKKNNNFYSIFTLILKILWAVLSIVFIIMGVAQQSAYYISFAIYSLIWFLHLYKENDECQN